MKGKKLLTISIIIVLIATLSPVNGDMAGEYLDKVAHLIVYFVLGVSILITYGSKSKALQLLLISALIGLIIEVIQQYIPGRNTSIFDGIANTIGLIMAMFFFEDKNDFSRKILNVLKKWN